VCWFTSCRRLLLLSPPAARAHANGRLVAVEFEKKGGDDTASVKAEHLANFVALLRCVLTPPHLHHHHHHQRPHLRNQSRARVVPVGS
jgi:hypothetical protein